MMTYFSAKSSYKLKNRFFFRLKQNLGCLATICWFVLYTFHKNFGSTVEVYCALFSNPLRVKCMYHNSDIYHMAKILHTFHLPGQQNCIKSR